MTNKKIARLAVCRLKGHVIRQNGRCEDCFVSFWATVPIATAIEVVYKKYDAMVEALDAE